MKFLFRSKIHKRGKNMGATKISKRESLSGRAEFRISRNDMFWNCCIHDWDGETFEFYHIKWSGYNDANWWDNVSEKASIATCEGDKGTEKKFKLDYKTLDVIEVI